MRVLDRSIASIGLACAGAVALIAVEASQARAATPDRFVAWLGSHPEVELVTVLSGVATLEPFQSRFPAGKPDQVPPSARVRIVDGRGSLICAVRGQAGHVCVRGPAAAHLWTIEARERKGSLVDVLMLGPLPDRRVAFYELRLPEATVRTGKPLPLNTRWVEPIPGPWWSNPAQEPVVRDARRAMRTASSTPSADEGPDWLADSVGFSVFTTGDPTVLRVETDTDISACVRGAKGWLCRPLPPISADDAHPGLPPTDSRLPRQRPVVYRAHAARVNDRTMLALEWQWIRSKVARTPGLEYTGAFVEVVELGPGAAAFSRRAVLELASARMSDLIDPSAGYPTVGGISVGPSGACLDVVMVGAVAPKMRTAPAGRYCVTEGRLAPHAR